MQEDKDTNTFVRTKIVRQLKDDKAAHRKRIQFLVEADNGSATVESIMEYNELCDMVETQLSAMNDGPEDNLWSFKRILNHQGPLKPTDPRYKGSRWNLLIDWDGHDATWEPRTIIDSSDKISVSEYAAEHNLLSTPGWKKYRNTARQVRKMNRQLARILKAKKKFNPGPKYNYGIRLPDRSKPYQELDREQGDTQWKDAHQYEIDCYDENNVFDDKGPATKELIEQYNAQGYQQIKLIWTYAV